MRFISLWLCGICIAMFAVQLLIGTNAVLLDRSLVWQEPWRVVTAIFAHANIGHLLSNLFALGLFGLVLEGRIGPRRVLWLFLISGLLINVFSPYPRSLGASGAIFAVLGALAVLRPFMTAWMGGMPMPMIIAGIMWLAQDILGVFIPTNVGNIAHIAGLFLGIGAGLFWRKEFADRPKPKSPRDETLEKELDAWEDKYMKK